MERKDRKRSAAGKALSDAGSALGGAARAEKWGDESRARIARAGALAKAGKLVRVRFTRLEYDLGWVGCKEQFCKIAFEMSRGESESVRARAIVDRNMLLRDGGNIFELSKLPDWVDEDLVRELVLAYRQYVVDSRIIPPPGLRPALIFGTLPQRDAFAIERVYDFADDPGGWRLVGWR